MRLNARSSHESASRFATLTPNRDGQETPYPYLSSLPVQLGWSTGVKLVSFANFESASKSHHSLWPMETTLRHPAK